MMTHAEFASNMQKIKEDFKYDEETIHIEMDNLMCELLKELGYEEGVTIFQETPKWYA